MLLKIVEKAECNRPAEAMSNEVEICFCPHWLRCDDTVNLLAKEQNVCIDWLAKGVLAIIHGRVPSSQSTTIVAVFKELCFRRKHTTDGSWDITHANNR